MNNYGVNYRLQIVNLLLIINSLFVRKTLL